MQVFGKFNIAEALRQQGINPCTISQGRNADAQFPFSDWTREQERQVNRLVDHIYAGFIQKVCARVKGLNSGSCCLCHISMSACLLDTGTFLCLLRDAY